jgi:vancomycin resistance protein VanW
MTGTTTSTTTGTTSTMARLTQRHPWLFPWAVRAHRVRRHLLWLRPGTDWARAHAGQNLPVRVKKHASLLMRELSEDEMVLQRNKVVNLRLASRHTDGLLIRPGETFSFNKVVGNCTRRKGYVEGMRLSNGDAISGVGGGICQLANLVHWMVLHSPLTVVERSEHSFDPFPDKGRVLPWGVGCSIVYNYVDLVVRNDTATTFQLRTWVAERHLRGELRADRAVTASYSVEARDEEFLRIDGQVYRRNEIWRTTRDKRTGDVVADELVKRNHALVKYAPPEDRIREVYATTRPRSMTSAGRASTDRSSIGLAS